MKIKVTEFAKRHFDKDFGGTKIFNFSIGDFENKINTVDIIGSLDLCINKNCSIHLTDGIRTMPGYAPFCKLVAISNFTDARVGSLPITLENYQYLRSGYSARRESELPVFSRWLELPLGKPKAEFLVLVLYSKEQIDKEAGINKDEGEIIGFDADWGIVAILGQSHNREEPMKPETMLRNALGTKEGGSGVPLDKEKYMESVNFWDKNATLK